MSEYISTIIYICIFSVILELILPENKLRKYIGVLVSLLIIFTLISPIINVLKNEDVTQVISSAIDNIQSKVEVNEYNFNNLEHRIIFSSVKEDLEEEIYTKCKWKLDEKFGISKVKINLNEEYKIEDINIYVRKLEQVANAVEIIEFVSDQYEIDASVINVIKEEE